MTDDFEFDHTFHIGPLQHHVHLACFTQYAGGVASLSATDDGGQQHLAVVTPLEWFYRVNDDPTEHRFGAWDPGEEEPEVKARPRSLHE